MWRKEEGSWLLLGFLLVTLFVVPFLRQAFPMLAPASSGAFVLLLLTGVLVVSRSTWLTLLSCVPVGFSIALEVSRQIAGGDPFAQWRIGAACVTVGLFTVVTLLRVFAPGPVTAHRLVFAVSAYLLVGLTWTFAYEWLEVMRPGSLSAAGDPAEGAYPPVLYFSFVTLTTVGYGDVTAVSQAARALSNLESLVGVLYPAVLIGRLVSLQTAGGPPAGTPPETGTARPTEAQGPSRPES